MANGHVLCVLCTADANEHATRIPQDCDGSFGGDSVFLLPALVRGGLPSQRVFDVGRGVRTEQTAAEPSVFDKRGV